MQQEAKEKIKALVEKYELVRNSGKLKSYTEEIAKTDKSIDQKVYELYGLREKEIKVIDGN